MTDQDVIAAPGLSQIERVFDTFVSPSETFTDIRRSTSWWLPFLLIVLATLAVAFSIDHKVGFQQVVETQIHLNPSQEKDQGHLLPKRMPVLLRKLTKKMRVKQRVRTRRITHSIWSHRNSKLASVRPCMR